MTGTAIDFDQYATEREKSPWLKNGLIALIIVALLVATGYGISKLMSGGAPAKKQVTTVKLIPDTPPPPPPPPPKEPPKEQPKQEQPKEIKVEQPKPAETPPAEQLKMEGAAGDGPSPFSSGPVNNEYKGGDVKTIGSDGGAAFNWYAGLIKTELERMLSKESKLTEGQYKIVLSVWMKPDGQVERVEWISSDAPAEIEQAAKTALNGFDSMREAPPKDMPQPVKLRITARKMG